MQLRTLLFVLPFISGSAAKSAFIGRTDFTETTDYGSLYGPSGQAELKDLDAMVLTGTPPQFVDAIAPQFFAILKAKNYGPGFWKSRIKYLEDVDGRPAIATHLLDNTGQNDHLVVINQPIDQAITPWWWWGEFKLLSMYMAWGPDQKSSIFRPPVDGIDFYNMSIMRMISGEYPTSFFKPAEGAASPEIDTEDKLLNVLSKYDQVPIVIKISGSEKDTALHGGHFAIDDVDLKSRTVSVWGTPSSGDNRHVRKVALTDLFDAIEEVTLPQHVNLDE